MILHYLSANLSRFNLSAKEFSSFSVFSLCCVLLLSCIGNVLLIIQLVDYIVAEQA